MRTPLFRSTLAASAAAAALVTGCGDQPTQPAHLLSADVQPAFSVGSDRRGQLGAALAFARDQSLRGLTQRASADRVAAAFEALAARVEANDRIGAERALGAASAAVHRYSELAAHDGGASTADLEALMLTLDHATVLVEERRRSSEARRP